MESNQAALRIFMLPWLAHGHISPFLELAKALIKRNFYIYFCSTLVNLEPVRKTLGPKYADSIELVEFHIPSSDDLPPHYHTTKNIPYRFIETLIQAFDDSAPNLSNILKTLKPDLFIYDINQTKAPTLAFNYGIPAIQYVPFAYSLVSYSLQVRVGPYSKSPFPEDYLSGFEKESFEKIFDLIPEAKDAIGLSWRIILVRTSKEIEGKYLEDFNGVLDKRVIPVGPLVRDHAGDEEEDNILQWLETKEPSSTVFVSFGSEYFCSKEELEEIANGLELSGVNFIWVVRSPLGEKRTLEELLPAGFLDRVGKRGLIVEGWAPQVKILQHSSIGGFVSHCGWNSVLESMKLGIPIIAMSMHFDQPVNAKLIADLGVGMKVSRDGHGRYRKDEIARVIRKMVMEQDGEDVKRKAKDMSDTLVKKGDEDMNDAAKVLVQICKEFRELSAKSRT